MLHYFNLLVFTVFVYSESVTNVTYHIKLNGTDVDNSQSDTIAAAEGGAVQSALSALHMKQYKGEITQTRATAKQVL